MDSRRRLVILRHAKAEGFAASDVERRLAPQGRADARFAGRWLADRGVVPDAAVVSSAVRTRETWRLVAEAAGWSVEPSFEDALYGGDELVALDLLRSTDEAVGTLVVVGHNPTVGMLAQQLDDGDGDPAAVSNLAMGYPTSALTVFEVDGAWAEIGPGGGRLRAFEVARADEGAE